MRYLFGFLCVLALGLMPMVGCGETEGTGGSGGDGGCCGYAGHAGFGGGGGGGVVTDCTGDEDFTQCKVGDNRGMCIEDVCVPIECDRLENGTECLWGNPNTGRTGPGYCEGGTCVPRVEDCTGVEYFTECMSGDVEGLCLGGECGVGDCSAVGDETFCIKVDEKVPYLALCFAGDCLRECAVMEEGAACHIPWTGFQPIQIGVCENTSCIP